MKLNKFVAYTILLLLFFPAAGFCQAWVKYDSIAQVKLKKNDLQGAIDEYTKALQADAGNTYLHGKRGDLRSKMNDYRGAIEDFTKVLERIQDATYYYQRGICFYMLKSYTEALADFDATVKDMPDISYELYFFRGNIKFKLQDVKGSIDEYTKSIEMRPGYAKAYYNRGVSKYFSDQKAEACKDITKAKELGFTDVDPMIKKYCDYYSTH